MVDTSLLAVLGRALQKLPEPTYRSKSVFPGQFEISQNAAASEEDSQCETQSENDAVCVHNLPGFRQVEGVPVAGPLLDAEGGSGVGLHGAAARDVAGESRGGEEESCDGKVGDGVEGFYAKEKSGQVAGEPEGADGSEERADESGTQTLANGHAKNIGASGAECDAETDFGRAARDGVGENAVNAGCGEEKGQHAEDGQENGIEALRSDGAVDDLVEGAHVGN